jgi:hypothetical protein
MVVPTKWPQIDTFLTRHERESCKKNHDHVSVIMLEFVDFRLPHRGLHPVWTPVVTVHLIVHPARRVASHVRILARNMLREQQQTDAWMTLVLITCAAHVRSDQNLDSLVNCF